MKQRIVHVYVVFASSFVVMELILQVFGQTCVLTVLLVGTFPGEVPLFWVAADDEATRCVGFN